MKQHSVQPTQSHSVKWAQTVKDQWHVLETNKEHYVERPFHIFSYEIIIEQLTLAKKKSRVVFIFPSPNNMSHTV